MSQSPLEPFPLSRFIDYSELQYYYPFGNTVAEDFLQSVVNDTGPTILSLGCGDIRSCFYTLWKHFGPESEQIYDSVHFVLNDKSATVLARNVLFLYLCFSMPSNDISSRATKEWIASLWSIWYNHELSPAHHQVLMTALTQLMRWSESVEAWSRCELGALVRFTSDATLEAIRKVWHLWQAGEVGVASVSAMHSLRRASQNHHFKTSDATRASHISSIAHSQYTMMFMKMAIKEISPTQLASMTEECSAYLKIGSIYAEPVLDLPHSPQQTTNNINITFFERTNGSYTMHYHLMPYAGFHQVHQYTPSAVVHASIIKSPPLAIKDAKHFTATPLLANSVQQFAMWLSVVSKVMACSQKEVCFTFHCGDAIALCQLLLQCPERYSSPNYFDAIYTSNLLDHVSPPALILASIPLLKSTGYLFTMSMNYRDVGTTGSEYLAKCFGFSPELYPVVLGICCIGHEDEYSSIVANQPIPVNMSHLSMCGQATKLLVWQNVVSELLQLTNLGDSRTLCKVLYNCAIAACTIALSPDASILLYTLSMEAFLLVLQRFVSRLHSRVDSSAHQFWEPLCRLLSQAAELKPHLLQLQTHSLLHGLHLHITLSQDNCPICTKQPVHEFISECSIFIANSPTTPCTTPRYYIDIHTSDESAIINSLAGYREGSGLKLCFFLPKKFTEGDVAFSVCHDHPAKLLDKQRNDLLCGHMHEVLCSVPQHLFLGPCLQHSDVTETSLLGDVTKHIGDASSFETVVVMTDACVAAYKSLSLKNLKASKIDLTCGTTLKLTIGYPYAVDMSKVHIKVSKRERTITVTAQRAISAFHNEPPLFLVNPDNQLALPQLRFSVETIETYCYAQFSRGDQPDQPTTALNNMKQTFMLLFKCAAENRHFVFDMQRLPGHPGVEGLVFVHNLLFDLQFDSPALDISFCFIDALKIPEIIRDIVLPCVMEMERMGGYRKIFIDQTELDLLKKTLALFESRTWESELESKRRYGHSFSKLKIKHQFKRAVIYPLYPDPDVRVQELQLETKFKEAFLLRAAGKPSYNGDASTDTTETCTGHMTSMQQGKQEQESTKLGHSSSSTEEEAVPHCSFCDRASTNLRKCTNCRATQYCGKECQTKHWKEHKEVCRREGASEFNVRKNSSSSFNCSRCESTSDVTKKCPGHQVSYCSKDKKDSSSSSACSRCRRITDGTKKCPCHRVSYCSKECQRLDWEQHKTECTYHKKQ